MTPRRRFCFRLGAILLFPALLGAAELALQVRFRMNQPARGAAFWIEEDDWLGYRLKRDFHTPDGRAYINAEGLRGDSGHVSDAPGDPRILMLGNSCVFGAGCLDTEIFPVLLEKRLRAEGRESAIVFNTGVGGYNSNQVRLYLERELWKYRPTHLVVYVGWNDLVTATWPFYSSEVQMGPRARSVKPGILSKTLSLLEESRLFWISRVRARRLMNRFLRVDHGVDVWSEAALVDYRRNLDAMVRDAKSHDVEIFFCRLPYDPARAPRRYAEDGFSYTAEGYRRLWERFQDEIKGAAAGGTVIDLPAAIAGVESVPEIIYDYNHLGSEGHRRVADSIAVAILPAITMTPRSSGR